MLYKTKQLPGVSKITAPAKPGLCKIYFIPVERVAQDPVKIDPSGTITQMPVLNSKFNVARLTNFSKNYTEVLKDDDGGDYYDITVTGTLPSESAANNSILRALRLHRYIVLVQTPAGLMKWLGSKENPVKALLGFDSGKRGGGTGAVTTITFTWQHDNKPLLLGVPLLASQVFNG
jgi:hypothetical protein